MKKSFIHQTVLSLSIVSCVAMAPNAASASPLTDTCKFMDGLISAGGKGGAKAIFDMTDFWSPAARDKIIPNLAPEFAKFTYKSGGVFLVADFGELMKEYMVVMEAVPAGAVFFRLQFAKNKGSLKFVNVDFNSKFRKIMTYGLAHKPEPQTCP